MSLQTTAHLHSFCFSFFFSLVAVLNWWLQIELRPDSETHLFESQLHIGNWSQYCYWHFGVANEQRFSSSHMMYFLFARLAWHYHTKFKYTINYWEQNTNRNEIKTLTSVIRRFFGVLLVPSGDIFCVCTKTTFIWRWFPWFRSATFSDDIWKLQSQIAIGPGEKPQSKLKWIIAN